jgi:xanthosine utilization system XapX-like protein
MDLISLLVVLVVVGLVWWLVTTYIPMPPAIKTVITVIAVLVLCIWLLQWAGIGNFHIGGPRG